MLELFGPLDTAFRTLSAELAAWFSVYPEGALWNVISDYCIGDPGKKNDTFAFSILVNHDTGQNIREHIAAVAPSDIKSSRSIPTGLIEYFNCPVAFSVTFVLPRNSTLLRNYVSVENIADGLPDLENVLRIMQANVPARSAYFEEVIARIRSFKRDIERRKGFNAKLARRVFLTAVFAAQIFKQLAVLKRPAYIRWISDRDAILDRYDGVVCDLAYTYFLLTYGATLGGSQEGELVIIDKPDIIFEVPERTGVHRHDELVRLPDYLAGTLADLDIETINFTHPKFETLFKTVFINSPNNAIIRVMGNAERLTAQRLLFQGTE